MTDKEIIEALECCTHDSTYCPKCPMDGNSYCRGELIEYSYDLIKRQTAEIEELREVIDDMSSYFPCCTNCEGKVDGLYNDKCMNLINHEFCAKKGLENIAQILRENEEQKAEIERLEEPKFKMVNIGARGSGKTLGMYRLIYQQGIEEFAEKLHELLKFYYPEQKFVHTHIDNLVKEMTE